MSTGADRAEPLVEVRTTGAVARVTVGNGARRNALTATGWTAVERTLRDLSHDDHVRVVVLRGRAATFCAGSDMTEWVEAAPEAVEESFARMEAAFRAVEECPVPVVAEIQGTAAGAGCQLALACDLRFMADSARMGMPIARLGILASPSFAARLVTLAGPSVARQLLYTGRLFDARSAVAAGLADQHLPEADLAGHTEAVLARIAEQPPEAIRAAKQAVAAALSPVREATRENERPAVSPTEFHQAVSAFLG